MFIAGGLDAARNPESKVKAAEAVAQPLKDTFPMLPDDTATLVKLNGIVQVGAGTLLAIGRYPRLAACVLIGSIIPTTYAGHRFWEELDDETRKQQQTHFLKNLGLLGGLILAALDTEGAPSLGWRARRGVHRMSAAVSVGRAKTESRTHQASTRAAEAGRRARRKANKAAIQANRAAVRGGRRANKAVSSATRSGVTLAAPYVRHVNEGVHEATRAALEGAEPYVSAGIERAGGLLASAGDHLPLR
jgi:uncharacterized membrane protein YphA (DoxX/SURF4 family)